MWATTWALVDDAWAAYEAEEARVWLWLLCGIGGAPDGSGRISALLPLLKYALAVLLHVLLPPLPRLIGGPPAPPAPPPAPPTPALALPLLLRVADEARSKRMLLYESGEAAPVPGPPFPPPPPTLPPPDSGEDCRDAPP